MICPVCKGRKLLEYEAGLIQIRCPACKGKGEVAEGGIVDDPRLAIVGDRPDDTIVGSGDTSKPRKPRKSKNRKRAKRGTG